jgi:hypothetical protein
MEKNLKELYKKLQNKDVIVKKQNQHTTENCSPWLADIAVHNGSSGKLFDIDCTKCKIAYQYGIEAEEENIRAGNTKWYESSYIETSAHRAYRREMMSWYTDEQFQEYYDFIDMLNNG